MAVIDIGSAATDRSGTPAVATLTFIAAENPANATGALTSMEFYAAADIGGMKAGTFYSAGNSDYTMRDKEAIGTVLAGEKRTFSGLDCSVTTGDLLGTYFTSGTIEKDESGDGVYYYSGDGFNGTQTYTFVADRTYSQYGEGATTAVAIPRYGFVLFQDPGIV